VLDEFPLTPNQKIDRKNLPVPEKALVESGIPYVPPKNKLEHIIAKIWQDLLKVPKIGINDNFFDLGGHSLLVVQAQQRLCEKIDKDLYVTNFFRFPTIRSLAEYLSKDSNDHNRKGMRKSINRAKSRKEAIKRLRSQRKSKKKITELIYREGKEEDCPVLAELVNISSGGIIEFLLHDLIPGMTPVQFVAESLQIDNNPRSYKNAIVAESNGKIVGIALSIPSHFHKITDDMKNLFPKERLEHLKHYYSARIENSLLLENIFVDEKFRGKGIGKKLITLTKNKAKETGFNSLSLIVFADNKNAQYLYKHCGFEVESRVELNLHELIPHEGGCILMKCDSEN
jgi:GNAT superfamily N-acetyltransferase/acyl carrier protein